MTLEVVHRHEKLAPESGVKFMATISGHLERVLGALNVVQQAKSQFVLAVYTLCPDKQ